MLNSNYIVVKKILKNFKFLNFQWWWRNTIFFDLYILTISETLQTVQHIIKTTEERAWVVQKVIHSSIIHHFHFCFAGYFLRSLCVFWFWRFVLYNVQASLFLSYLFLICYCHYYRNKHRFKTQQYWAQNIYCFSPNWYLSSVNGFICWKHFVMYIVTLTCNIKNSCYSLLAS